MKNWKEFCAVWSLIAWDKILGKPPQAVWGPGWGWNREQGFST